MTKQKFLYELDLLLMDLSLEDRQEALDYYASYLEEAIESEEDDVTQLIGTPESVSAIIKGGLSGHFEETIELGSDGLNNSDYRKTYEVIDVADSPKQKRSYKEKWSSLETRDRIILIGLLIFSCIPLSAFALGSLGAVFGIGFGSLMAVLGVLFAAFVIAIAFYIVAITFIVLGALQLFVQTGAGLILIGCGILVLLLANVCAKVSFWFVRTAIPTVVRWVVDFFSKLVNREVPA